MLLIHDWNAFQAGTCNLGTLTWLENYLKKVSLGAFWLDSVLGAYHSNWSSYRPGPLGISGQIVDAASTLERILG